MSSNDTASPELSDFAEIIRGRELECWALLNATSTQTLPGLYCEGTFDGWSCWPDTPAGTSANTSCPGFITGFDPKLFAHKECELNGSWYKHPETQKSWSNYTSCIDQADLSVRITITSIYETGYLISLIALLASLGIYTYFKSLRCSRTTLHIHLFVSFAVNNALWLIWYRFILKPEIISENGVGCRIFHVVLQYFLVTNYCWMLCEGLYLHTLLVNAFLSEERLVKWLFALGWAIPAIAIIIYSSLRAQGEGEDLKQCWMNESKYTNVLIVPVCVSMVLNLVFLCNIVRVLMTKLRAGPHVGSQRPSRTLLQALRATLLLVPLLGLHYLLTPFRPEKGHSWEFFYEVLSAITASLQGLCVATLFCFCNGEVHAQMKRHFTNWKDLYVRHLRWREKKKFNRGEKTIPPKWWNWITLPSTRILRPLIILMIEPRKELMQKIGF